MSKLRWRFLQFFVALSKITQLLENKNGMERWFQQTPCKLADTCLLHSFTDVPPHPVVIHSLQGILRLSWVLYCKLTCQLVVQDQKNGMCSFYQCSDEVFSKILKKPSIVQKELYLIWKPRSLEKNKIKNLFKKKIQKKVHFPAPPILNIFSRKFHGLVSTYKVVRLSDVSSKTA